jgi:ligand-binding sensor domain-containing protein
MILYFKQMPSLPETPSRVFRKSMKKNIFIKIPTWIGFFILWLEVFTPVQLCALDPQKTINQYGHNVWSRQNGLPVNAVKTILQTRDGYIWLGTTAGLLRFDGDRFEWISTDQEDSKNHETINALYESKDSSLWIGTANNWIYRLKNKKIFRHGESDGILSRNINAFFESRAGHLWIGTSSGLYKFSEGKFTSVPIDPKYITSIAEDARGRIWIGTYSGIRILGDSNKVRTMMITVGSKNNAITSICADRQGNMWIGTYNGLVRWKNNTVTTFGLADGLSDFYITSIREDQDGNLWIGTNSGGINRLSRGRCISERDVNDFGANNVLSILEDREGSIWVCTSNGLNQYRDVSITPYTSKEGLENDNISSVLEMPDRSLFFLSEKGASVTQIKNGKISKLSVPIGPAYVAHDGSLWIGQRGILSHLKNNHMERYSARNGLPAKWISAITEDDSSLIFYTDHEGIFRFIHGQIKPYSLKDGQQYPPANYVICFFQQEDNILWVGATSGLAKIQDGIMTNFTTTDGLAGNWISSIYDDQQGSLWISSPQGGLTRFRNGKFIAYNTKVGLFNDEIYCVLGDDQGDLWLSSPRGIGYIHRQNFDEYEAGKEKLLHTRIYTTADGMKTDECFGDWQPAGWKADDGHLWFATKKGAVLIDPKTFKKNELPPPVLIEKVVIDQQTIPLIQPATISPGKEKFEFHYTGLSFLVPEKVIFKYILKGYDKEYISAGTRRIAYYTNLPPGRYTFSVMACNNDGVWNEMKSGFSFELKSQFYQTYWFFGLCFIAFCGVLFSAYRIRVWQLLKREEELRERIQEATANIKTLGGLIPICANCKKIRDDRGYWDQLEAYIQNHSGTEFAQSICPECKEKLSPGAATSIKDTKNAKN